MEKVLEETKATTPKKAPEAKEIAKTDDKKVIFKELADLTPEEISKLGKVTAILSKRTYKKGGVGYEISIKLHEYLEIKNSFMGNESEYFVIMLQLKLDPKFAEHSLRVPCRFVQGINKNDKPYLQIELILGDGVYFGNLWINGSDLKLFNMVMPDVKIETRERKIEDQTYNIGNE